MEPSSVADCRPATSFRPINVHVETQLHIDLRDTCAELGVTVKRFVSQALKARIAAHRVGAL